jgi:hypothetical protein
VLPGAKQEEIADLTEKQLLGFKVQMSLSCGTSIGIGILRIAAREWESTNS